MTPNPHEVAACLAPQVTAVLMARAKAEVVTEEVTALQAALLAERCYMNQYKPTERITEPKDAWMMPTTDHAAYCARAEIAAARAGYRVPAGYCPALMAQEAQRVAEHALIEAAQQFFPEMTPHRILCGTDTTDGLTLYRKYIDLLCRLVVNHPTFTAPETPQPCKEA